VRGAGLRAAAGACATGASCASRPRRLERSERYLERYERGGIFFARLLPFVRHVIGIPAGIVRMNLASYCVMTVLGSALWCSVLAWFGQKVLGDEPRLMEDPEALGRVVKENMLWLVAGVVVLTLSYLVMVRMTKSALRSALVETKQPGRAGLLADERARRAQVDLMRMRRTSATRTRSRRRKNTTARIVRQALVAPGAQTDRQLDGQEPNSVVNLMTGFIATELVSLNGSPTVSPTTDAACSGVPLALSSTSTTFLALSQAPPALAMKMAWNRPNSAIAIR
jgi:hypothetical protein